MAALTNTRWELFALGLAAGKSQANAYREAGYSESTANACILAKREEVRARVAELIEQRTQFQAQFVENADLEHLGAVDEAMKTGTISRTWVIKELMDNVVGSREANQYAASNQALKLLGSEIGMFGTKGGDEDDDKAKSGAGNNSHKVDVNDVNRLLSSVGYDGPAITISAKRVKTPVLNDQST